MTSTIQLDMVPIATRSLRTLLDVGLFLEASSAWKGQESIDREVALTVKKLFDLLAWSDGKLDAAECRLMNQLSQVDENLADLLDAVKEFHPANPLHEVVPPLLEAAVKHDRRYGGKLAHIVVDSLEIVGYAIIAVNGVTLDIEKSELSLYVDNLRALANLLSD